VPKQPIGPIPGVFLLTQVCVGSARRGERRYTLGAINLNGPTLIWPIVRICDKTCAAEVSQRGVGAAVLSRKH